jgi:hypothetical protein
MIFPAGGTGRWRRLLGDERGSASGWAMGTMFVGLLMSGLVFDGGAAMTTKASALTVAQQAARAGADQLDLATLRTTGEVQLDPATAEQVAAGWLEQADVAGTVSATTERVTVTVTATGSAVLLSVVGITSYELSATATAEAIQP